MLVVRNSKIITTKKCGQFRIALVSDLHIPVSERLALKTIRAIQDNNVDAILIAGDLRKHRFRADESAAFLKRMHAQTGKKIYMVMGDSDPCSLFGPCIYCTRYSGSPPDSISCLILRDSTVFLSPSITVSGLDYTKDDNWQLPDFGRETPPETFNVFLLHTTAKIEESFFGRFDLSLAGNTHGGQVAPSVFISIALDPEIDGRFMRGRYYPGGKPLIVTSGIGTSFLPIRFGVPPEVIIIDIEGK